jgi:hypothetical protein
LKPRREDRTHSKAYKVMLTRDEMDTMAAVCGRYFDAMREQGIVLPPKVALNALHALHKMKTAVKTTAPIIVIDTPLAPEDEVHPALITMGDDKEDGDDGGGKDSH